MNLENPNRTLFLKAMNLKKQRIEHFMKAEGFHKKGVQIVFFYIHFSMKKIIYAVIAYNSFWW